LTRAADLSVLSNIAEGFERESNREFVNFLPYAKGSCGELRTPIFIDRDIGRGWIQERIEIFPLLAGLIKTKRVPIAEG